MWLPKDERRLLAGYYRLIGGFDVCKLFRSDDLNSLLRIRQQIGRIQCYGESGAPVPPQHESADMQNMSDFKSQVRKLINIRSRIRAANGRLAARGLITIGEFADNDGSESRVQVSLSLEGYDLGRQYSRWWDRSGLWFDFRRNHWIWALSSFAGGILGALLVNWLA